MLTCLKAPALLLSVSDFPQHRGFSWLGHTSQLQAQASVRYHDPASVSASRIQTDYNLRTWLTAAPKGLLGQDEHPIRSLSEWR